MKSKTFDFEADWERIRVLIEKIRVLVEIQIKIRGLVEKNPKLYPEFVF
jgi:hypothetical protein